MQKHETTLTNSMKRPWHGFNIIEQAIVKSTLMKPGRNKVASISGNKEETQSIVRIQRKSYGKVGQVCRRGSVFS